MARIRTHLPASITTDSVGGVFIDVLFAAVVTKALEVSSMGTLPPVGQIQLALAMTVTISSWIGYHNSSNRTRYRILFFNLPLWQFFIEIAHVYVYWLLVVTSEGVGIDANSGPSSRPDALLTSLTFVLFVAWDLIALRMRISSHYPEMLLSDDKPARRHATLGVSSCVLLVAAFTWLIDPQNVAAIMVVDIVLIALVVAHRWLQNIVQPAN